MRFIYVGALSTTQTVTDGLLPPEEEASRTNCEAFNVGSAQLCGAVLCTPSLVCLSQ